MKTGLRHPCPATFQTASHGTLACTRQQNYRTPHQQHEWRKRLPGAEGAEAVLMVRWWADAREEAEEQ